MLLNYLITVIYHTTNIDISYLEYYFTTLHNYVSHCHGRSKTQLYGHSRQGGHGGISMRSDTPTTPKRFNSPLTQNLFCNY